MSDSSLPSLSASSTPRAGRVWVGYAFFALLSVAAVISLLRYPLYWAPPPKPHDLMYFYVPGAIWLEGGSPYHVSTFISHPLWVHGPNVPSGFGYQPSSWWIDIPLALLPIAVATRVFWYLNLVWLAACGGLLYRLIARQTRREDRVRWWLAAAAMLMYVGLTSVRENIHTNQGVLLFTVLLMGGLVMLERDRPHWGAALLGLTLYKYSMGLWIIVALALVRRSPRILLIALAVHVALCAVPVFLFPTPVTWADFQASVDAYVAHGTMSPFNPGVTTIRAILTQAFLVWPDSLANRAGHGAFLLAGLASFYVTRHAYASPTLRYAWVGLNLVWTPVAGFSHAYDFVIILPLFAGLVLAYRELRPLSGLLMGVALVMLMVPMHVQLPMFGLTLPYHALWFILLHIGITAWLLRVQPRPGGAVVYGRK